MKSQPRNKILIILIGILLAANIVLLSFFLFDKPEKKEKGERKNSMAVYLKNEIGFTDQQMVQFDSIKAQHRREAKVFFDNVRARKESSFKAIGAQGFSDSAIRTAAIEAARKQEELEMVMLQHLKDIRGICTPVQQQKFDTGFYKVMGRGREEKNK